MFHELYVNGTLLPRPDESLDFESKKLKTEYETEAGTTLVSVRRESKLTVKGKWTLTGRWAGKFREWAAGDTVNVACFFPDPAILSGHECQFTITSEKHVRLSREQLGTNGLYQIAVEITEL